MAERTGPTLLHRTASCRSGFRSIQSMRRHTMRARFMLPERCTSGTTIDHIFTGPATTGRRGRRSRTGIPDTAFTRVIREDPNKRGLLYAGTETGMYVSFDNGERWQSLQLNLPVVPITDLAVQKREKELVVATQGRSFWILDDLPLLHQTDGCRWFQCRGRNTTLQTEGELSHARRRWSVRSEPTATVGRNPANGVVVYYSLKAKPTSEVELEFLDSAGKSIRKFTGRVRKPG